MKILNTLILVLIGCTDLMAQEQPDTVALDTMALDTMAVATPAPRFRWMAEAQGALSTGSSTPFWLVNNRQGLSSLRKANGYVRGAFFKDMDSEPRFSWGFGVDLVVPYHYTSNFVVQQLYAAVRYRSLSLTIGSNEWSNGVVDQALSSGDMLFSQNSRPIPQVRLEMKDYQPVPYTKKWLSVKGYFSMGMFTDERFERKFAGPDGTYVENLLFHSKGLFLRGGDPTRHQLTVEGGLEMGAQFGGQLHHINPYTGQPDVVYFPHGLKDIIKVIIPMSGGNANDPMQVGETTNVLGNHVGQWTLAATWRPRNADWSIRAYYEHYFDDHSMMLFDHPWKDMLLGGEVTLPRNRFVDKVVYEYLITKDQSGAVYWDHTPEIPSQISGTDDYYNHYLYTGWQHWGMGMGNPLLISPIYNKDGSFWFYHNRIKGHHLGLSGHPTNALSYRLLLSYTRSWGSYRFPTHDVLHNFNSLLELNYRHGAECLPHWDFRLSLAADGGNLLGGSFGAMLTARYTGFIK